MGSASEVFTANTTSARARRLRADRPRLLSRLSLNARQIQGSLVCWPVQRVGGVGGWGGAGPSWLALPRALEDGFVSIDAGDRESVSSGGCIKEVELENRGPQPVVVVCGQELPAIQPGLCAVRTQVIGAFERGRIRVESVGPSSQPADRLARGYATLEDQLGFVAAIGSRIVGLELMGSAALYVDAAELLLRRYAVRAVPERANRPPSRPRRDRVVDAQGALLHLSVSLF